MADVLDGNMIFWLIAAVLTLVACAAVLWPLVRAPESALTGHDVEVYKDQLAEVERDAGRGLIEPGQAELARAEVARRLIKADQTNKTSDASGAPALGGGVRIIGLVAVLAVPLVSWGLYAFLGSAGAPDQPLQARLERSPAQNSIEELVARAERHLANSPDDARGWQVLGPIYLRQGRYGDARMAFSNAIRLSGSTAALEAGLGEALVGIAGGVVTVEAVTVFQKALKQEPNEPRSRYFLATALAQQGNMAEARKALEAMRVDLPGDSPWQVVIQRTLAETVGPPGVGQPGPDAQAVAASENMTDAERRQMIESMVANLDAKLRDNPGDVEGWQRLIRSYVVLGRQGEARIALGRALQGLAGNADGLAQIKDFAAAIGVEQGG
jgi:cytochrome c-type biogenesis protein CcmH